MPIKRLLASVALTAGLIAAVAAGPAIATADTPTSSPALPQVSSAEQGSTWLAAQFTPDGFIPSSTTPGQPDLSATANAVLALSSTGNDLTTAQAGLDYLETQVDQYVTVDGSDDPGQLALLILDAHALGVDPTSFGGTNLVSRLLATEQTSGNDAGLFGVQDPTYDGAYRQGLSLSALAAAGVTSGSQVAAAETWLLGQQCPDGGWTSYITTDNPCNGSPADYAGPDTNSTALAVEGLDAQGALGSTSAENALSFITSAQDSDGGWGYEPNAVSSPGSTDPDSTSLVIQAIISLGQSPSSAQFQQGNANPVSSLLSFQLNSGSGNGAFYYPGSTDPDVIATYEAVPAMAGVMFPLGSTTTSASASPSTVTTGAEVTYSASVTSPTGMPTGSVAFSIGNTALCTTPALTSGSGSCTATNAPVGSGQVVTATYSGAAEFGLSLGSTTINVSAKQGYWLVGADGGIFTFGDAGYYGSEGGQHLNRPIVGMAATPDNKGYWLVGADGGIFTFGDAGYYGSEGGQHLNQPIVGMAPTPDGNGYWLVGADGGIFTFGDAAFYGSEGGQHLNQPIVGMAATPDNKGYWLVGADGGIFTFGDAGYYGSEGGQHLNQPIVGMAPTPDGNGYWLVGADGGIFTFGDAAFYGSEGGQHLNQPIVGMAATPDGKGYWLVGADGGIFTFGDAGYYGSEGGQHLNAPVVGMASVPASGST